MSAQREVKPDPADGENVSWIGRDRAGNVHEIGARPERETGDAGGVSPPATDERSLRDGEPAREQPEGRDLQSPPSPEPVPGTSDELTAGPPREPGLNRWVAIGVGLAIALLAILAAIRYTGQSSAPPQGAAGAVPLVSARAPGLASVTATVSFTGAIFARYDLPIGTEGETGRITAVYVEAGEHVRKGQALARLDDSILRPQVERLAASLDEARANAELAEAEYARAEAVRSAGALSAEDIQKRRAAAATAAAEVKVAAAQLAEYQARLSHTEVRAPVDGLVLTRSAEVGQIATPGGTALFRLARAGEMEMRGQVAEQDMPSLRVGQPAAIHLTGIDKPFPGRVRLLGAIIDPQTRLGEIRVALDSDPELRPGAFARGDVVVGRGERPVLPQTAVLSDEQGAFVYIIGANHEIERRPVRVTDTTSAGVVIGSGLTGREQVVMTAAAFLRPGERVAIAQETSGP
ncbi:MAG TPA: efflux RND transporter periplasmic adaptor subunit [Steroidobacteraceae bacterium]